LEQSTTPLINLSHLGSSSSQFCLINTRLEYRLSSVVIGELPIVS